MSNLEALHRRAKALNLNGLLAHWEEAAAAGWLATLIDWEEQERTRRSLERRLRAAHIGRFKPTATSIGPGPNAATAQPSKR